MMESIYQEIANCEKENKAVALCVIISTTGSTPRKAGSKMLVYSNGSVSGSVGGGNLELQVIEDAKEVIKSGKVQVFDHNLITDHKMGCGGTAQVYIEPINRRINLYIFGAGHIGNRLARMASKLNFNVTLIDERAEVLELFADDSVYIINKNYNDAFAELEFDMNCFITSVSHLHGYDRDIVAHCAKVPHAYLGMIGSTRKIETAKKMFRDNNLLTEKEMNEIDWPIGLPISCQTPDEIVISIIAKLIDVRGNILNN